MRPRILAALLLAMGSIPSPARAAEVAPEPLLIRVRLEAPGARAALLRSGLDVVSWESGSARILEWPGDALRLGLLGLTPELIDSHPGRGAAERAGAVPNAAENAARASAHGAGPLTGPPAFGAGSMGGYWTMAEVKQKLDALVANDVHGVVADKIDTLGWSVQGRPIWGLRLGRQAPGPGGPPVAFFNALTHAREPMGMETLLLWADQLLQGYGVDSTATALLDQRVIYMVPVVNPDGYAYNESIYTTQHTFGFWRKNLADNNHSSGFDPCCDGVDLNRNYGYQWGYDNVGSDSSGYAAGYRGPGPFSEPETRAQRDIIAALRPATGLSFHSYQDVLMYPWGWTPAPVPDVDAYREWTDLLERDNAFQSNSENVMLYPVNGEFNDWCYGDTVLKPRAFTWTAEQGSDDDGFWPPPSRMPSLANELLNACTVVAELAGPWVRATRAQLVEPALDVGYAASLRILARNLGTAATPGPLTATLTPIDAGGRVFSGQVTYPALASRTEAWPDPANGFRIGAADTVTLGRLLRFQVEFRTAFGFLSRDTVAVPAGTPTTLVADDATAGLSQWNPGGWGIWSDASHPAPYFDESPGAGYANNATNVMLLTHPLDLSHTLHAYATFGSRWNIQRDYDAATVEASRNGSKWDRVAGTGTRPGSGIDNVQIAGLPVYSGTRWNFAPERVDLSSYRGASGIRFRFTMQSDASAQYDGFAFDSLRIVIFDPAAQPTPAAVQDPGPIASPALAIRSANPSRGPVRFEFALARDGAARIDVMDVSGRRVQRVVSGLFAHGRYAHAWDGRDAAGRAAGPGIYWMRLETEAGTALTRFARLQ